MSQFLQQKFNAIMPPVLAMMVNGVHNHTRIASMLNKTISTKTGVITTMLKIKTLLTTGLGIGLSGLIGFGAISLSPVAWSSTTILERVNYSYANHEESVEDIKVKILGGDVAVRRYYRIMRQDASDANNNIGLSGALGNYRGNSLYAGKSAGAGSSKRGVWQFHRQWHDLIFLDRDAERINPTGLVPVGGTASVIKYIDRNDYVYIKAPGQNYYHYEYNGADLRITPTDTGYRWSNRKGDWIDYDQSGKALASGNKNDVGITLTRDAQGYIWQYKDHLDKVILTWTYVGDKPTRVEDYTGRRVVYTWTGNDLTAVTTTRGHQWQYAYESVSGNRILTSKTDPEGQTFQYKYQMSTGGYQTIGGSNSSAPDVTIIGNSIPASNSLAAKNTNSYTIAVPPTLVHTAKVYPDGKRQQYTYHYDTNTQAYMLLETNTDGYESERWYDLDGQVRNNLQGGKVASNRVRVDDIAISTDSYGNKTTTTYTRWEAIASQTYADGSTISYRYHPNYNFVTLETDELGVKTQHSYDEKGNRIQTIEGYESDDPRVMKYVYDNNGYLITEKMIGKNDGVTTTNTVEISYTYDDYGNLIKVTDGNGNITQYQDYNAIGQAQTLIDARGHTWQSTYDAHGNRLTETTPLGFVTEYTYDSLHRLIQTKDAEGRITKVSYDSRNKPTTIENNAGGIRTMTYRVDGLISSSKDESGQVTSYRYDRSQRLIDITDGVGNQTLIAYERGDELAGGRIGSVTTPNAKISYTYDNRNRVTQQALVSVKDDGLSNPTQTQYNARGDVIATTDGNGLRSTYEYNVHRERTQHTNPANETIRYHYDSRGNLVQVIDAENHLTRYTYDNNNNTLSETRPNKSTTALTQQLYTYDARNQLIQKADYNGHIARYTWDNDQRLTQHTDTRTGTTAPERRIVYTYDKTRLLTSHQDHHTQSTYQYDALARISQQSTTFNGSITKTLKTAYHANSQIRQKVDPEGHQTSYFYDGAGKINQLGIQNAGSIVVNEYEGHLPKAITYPGGINRHHEYDGLSRLKRILVNDNANTPQMDYQYQFDVVGNITQKNTLNGNFTYQYDNAYRLTQANQPNGFGDQSYRYDGNSNRIQQTHTIGSLSTTKNYSYDNQQALTGISSILNDVTTTINQTYDNNGALTSDGTRTYQYNSFARLAEIIDGADTLASYTYDPYGRRISKTVDSTTTYFLYGDTGAGLVGEYTQTGELIRGYKYQPTAIYTTDPVALKTKSENQTAGQPTQYDYSFYQNDHLGTPQRLMQLSGATVWQGEYDVFGSVSEIITQVQNPLHFAGQYEDKESGFSNNWNRYYSSRDGRYISNDPIGLYGGINTYVYANNDPLYYMDPYGLFFTPDTVADIGLIAYDAYRIYTDNIAGDCNNLGENLGALGANVLGAVTPGATGLGTAYRAGGNVPKGAADAAKRLGVNLDNVPITNGVARTKIDVSSTLNPTDINKLKDAFKAHGATKAEVDTGFIANEKLDSFLRRRVQDGKPFNGGTVRFSNSKNSDFTIDFDL
ncbi:hypothetical protein AB835_03990 [Candidatus Endobugula sertula]|uniref:Uncharacterized protein n=1 Tax=Candidatus Endobugula sertula TaxID=62101 RepID=A0A1D2QS19_9GAMM|nr:hypothetical protein AB835_03990 [Candidatus Endobugula sertula]